MRPCRAGRWYGVSMAAGFPPLPGYLMVGRYQGAGPRLNTTISSAVTARSRSRAARAGADQAKKMAWRIRRRGERRASEQQPVRSS